MVRNHYVKVVAISFSFTFFITHWGFTQNVNVRTTLYYIKALLKRFTVTHQCLICRLKELKTVSSAFQDVEFDGFRSVDGTVVVYLCTVYFENSSKKYFLFCQILISRRRRNFCQSWKKKLWDLWVDKMKRSCAVIGYPSGQDGAILSARDYPLCPEK